MSQTEVDTDIPTPEVRAATGAKWLDDVDPNWFKRVKVNTMHIGSTLSCIIAQVSKQPFSLEWCTERGAPVDEDSLLEWGLLNGFRLNWGQDGDELTVAWATEIAARKEK